MSKYSNDFTLFAVSKFELRPAGPADRSFAEALYLQTMLPLLHALGLGNEAGLRLRFSRAYKVSRSKIAMAEGAAIGWIQVSTVAAGFHLDQLHLVPAWRNRGIGGALVRRLIERARVAHVAVALDVIRGNPALDLYRRLGFRVVGDDDEKFKMQWSSERATASASET